MKESIRQQDNELRTRLLSMGGGEHRASITPNAVSSTITSAEMDANKGRVGSIGGAGSNRGGSIVGGVSNRGGSIVGGSTRVGSIVGGSKRGGSISGVSKRGGSIVDAPRVGGSLVGGTLKVDDDNNAPSTFNESEHIIISDMF